MPSTETLTLTDFLLARIADDESEARDSGADAMMGHRWKHYPQDAYEEIQALALTRARRLVAECAAKRRIVEWHKSWPVLAQTEPTFDPAFGGDVDTLSFKMSQRMAWLTEQEYRSRFGDEPPTAPILRIMASVYAGHPDYRDEWRA